MIETFIVIGLAGIILGVDIDETTMVVGIVGIILGGGGVGALVPVVRYRTDKGNVIAVGAESAVQSLTAALKRSDERVSHLEAENQILRVSLEELKIDLDQTKRKLDQILKDYK